MYEKAEILRAVVSMSGSASDLHAAIDELLSPGFRWAELSVLAGDYAVDEKLEHLKGI